MNVHMPLCHECSLVCFGEFVFTGVSGGMSYLVIFVRNPKVEVVSVPLMYSGLYSYSVGIFLVILFTASSSHF